MKKGIRQTDNLTAVISARKLKSVEVYHSVDDWFDIETVKAIKIEYDLYDGRILTVKDTFNAGGPS